MAAAAKWVMRWVLNFAGWGCGLGAGVPMTALQHERPVNPERSRISGSRRWKLCSGHSRVFAIDPQRTHNSMGNLPITGRLASAYAIGGSCFAVLAACFQQMLMLANM
jgi:hypothetical protein